MYRIRKIIYNFFFQIDKILLIFTNAKKIPSFVNLKSSVQHPHLNFLFLFLFF